MEEMRLQKYVSDCGLMSRRSAEKEIEQGFFTVNGEKAYIGQKVVPGVDDVRYKGRKLEGGGKKVYLMLYKPRGYVTTLSDEEMRRMSVLDTGRSPIYDDQDLPTVRGIGLHKIH